MVGLDYVRDVPIEGKTYPAYGWEASSPLVIFRLTGVTFAARTHVPLKLDGPTRGYFYAGGKFEPDQGQATLSLQYALISRGGIVMSAGTPPMFSGTSRRTTPSTGNRVSHAHRLTLRVHSPTCTLTPRAADLQDATAALLANEGDTALEQDVDVRMECPFSGIHVELTLSDAGNAAKAGSELTPTKGSTAKGVSLQLLRSGSPVQFNQKWVHGASTTGSQVIPLSVRYRRTNAPLSSGTIIGEAILKADYR